MNKQTYIDELRRHLSKLPQPEVAEILADYQEHFDVGVRSGKSEEQISASLGHPRIVAQSHLMTALINEVSTTPSTLRRSSALFRMMMVLFVLAPFNFLVLIGPFLFLVALLAAGWALPVAVSGVSIAGLGVFFSSASEAAIGFFPGLSLTFMFLGTLGVALMGGMIMWLVSRVFIRLVSSYIRWNFNIITARSA